MQHRLAVSTSQTRADSQPFVRIDKPSVHDFSHVIIKGETELGIFRHQIDPITYCLLI